MKKLFVISGIAIGVILAPSASSHAQQPVPTPSRTLLIQEKDLHQLNVIDPATLKVLAKIPLQPGPHEVVASDDGKFAFAASPGGGASVQHTISVVDLVAQKALPPIDTSPLTGVHGLAFAGGELYFTAGPNRSLGRYNLAMQKIDWVMGIGENSSILHVSKDQTKIFASGGSSVSILEAGPGGNQGRGGDAWKLTNVPIGSGSEGVGVSPDWKQTWSGNSKDQTVTVVDVATKKLIQTIPISVIRADELEVSEDGKHVVVAGLGTPPPPGHVGASVDVNDPDAITICVIDVASGKEVKTFKPGGGSEAVLMDPVSNRAFVSVTGANKVVVIDLDSLTISAEIPLEAPDGSAWAVRQ